MCRAALALVKTQPQTLVKTSKQEDMKPLALVKTQPQALVKTRLKEDIRQCAEQPLAVVKTQPQALVDQMASLPIYEKKP